MSSETSALLNMLVLAAWLGIGLLIARRSHAAGTALIWMVVLGPIGLILVAYGEAQRARVGPEPQPGPAEQDLFIPVEVRTEDGWVPGRCTTGQSLRSAGTAG